MKLNPGITEVIRYMFAWSNLVTIKKVGETCDGNTVFQMSPLGHGDKNYGFQLNRHTAPEDIDRVLCKILMCSTFRTAEFAFGSRSKSSYLVSFNNELGEHVITTRGATLCSALVKAEKKFDDWCEKQKEKTMKTREQLLLDVSNLQVEISTAGSHRLFPPTLCLNLITALSDFQCIATEMEMSPSNESILEMLKEKINQGFLKESEVVDALIGNTREQSKKIE